MNAEVATMPPAQHDAELLLPLMREYRDTLEKYFEPLLRRDLRQVGIVTWQDLMTDTDWERYLKDKLAAIMPQIEKVASNASGLLEHTELDFLTSRELKLRLTELEVLFKHYHQVIAPKKK